ncbi:unnamed protein product [Trichogramma brassicae]|uniref:G-protein coupled receptors family 1 profile domain-containing protein n=1 Tax=Trichogramma brassicae TaxID=86971 RepID=A0A6H5IA18_9HYME|nr:unnamed protein product [Trichogramma brassicae]
MMFDEDDRSCLELFQSLLIGIEWEYEVARLEFIEEIEDLMSRWRGPRPNLHELFPRAEVVEWLLSDALNIMREKYVVGLRFIKFVLSSGYRDRPRFENGEYVVARTTPIHRAAIFRERHAVSWDIAIEDLFRIYDRWDLNYVDEDTGLTHFHVACMSNSVYAARQFVQNGLSPDYYPDERIDPPLHLALKYHALNFERTAVIKMLLRRGADPNLANAEGTRPLHVICRKFYDGAELAHLFFKLNDELRQSVDCNVEDDWGRTPLQWAAAILSPDLMDLLLYYGADWDGFVFPDESLILEAYERTRQLRYRFGFKMKLAMRARLVDEYLYEQGYELQARDATKIMELLARHRVFDVPSYLEEEVLHDLELVENARNVKLKSDLTLLDALRLRPAELEKRLEPWRLHAFWENKKLTQLNGFSETWHCEKLLCEKMLRGFVRSWGLAAFMEVNRYELPFEAAEVLVDKLMNDDLWRVCKALHWPEDEEEEVTDEEQRQPLLEQPRRGSKSRSKRRSLKALASPDESYKTVGVKMKARNATLHLYTAHEQTSRSSERGQKCYIRLVLAICAQRLCASAMKRLYLSMQQRQLEFPDLYKIYVDSSRISYNNETSSSLPTLPPNLTFTRQSLYIVIAYGVCFFIATIGNLTVFVTLSRGRYRKSRISLMICHLSIADLLVAFFTIPIERTCTRFIKRIRWRKSNEISWSRIAKPSKTGYFAVLYPLRMTVARRRGKMMLTVAWIFSIFCAVPQFGENYDRPHHDWEKFTARDAFVALTIVDRLEKREYELDRRDAMTIMKLFATHGLFENSTYLDTRWCDDRSHVTHWCRATRRRLAIFIEFGLVLTASASHEFNDFLSIIGIAFNRGIQEMFNFFGSENAPKIKKLLLPIDEHLLSRAKAPGALEFHAVRHVQFVLLGSRREHVQRVLHRHHVLFAPRHYLLRLPEDTLGDQQQVQGE